MKRALFTAGSGLLYFAVSLLLMLPLRINPVPNYNLIFIPCVLFLFFILFYKACTEQEQAGEGRAYLYGFFAGITGWQVFGELASITVPAGYVLRLSTVDIKSGGALCFVVCGWLCLKILWYKKILKPSLLVCLLTFLGIWTFELYMENYSAVVPLAWMPVLATSLALLFLLVSAGLLVLAARTPGPGRQTILGCLLYLTLSVVLMGVSQWQKPQSFYLNSEADSIRREIIELEARQKAIQDLKLEMGKR